MYTTNRHYTPTSRTAPRAFTRRALLTTGVVGLGLAAVPTAVAFADSPDGGAKALPDSSPTLSAPGIKIVAGAKGSVHVFDEGGTQRMLFNGVQLSGQGHTTSGTASIITQGGHQAIEAIYTGQALPANAVFTVTDHRVHIEYSITGSGFKPRKSNIMRRAPGGATETYLQPYVWTRDPRGGVPFEQPLMGMTFQEDYPDSGEAGYLIIPRLTHPDWRSNWAVAAPASETGTEQYSITIDFVLSDQGAEAAALVANDDPLLVTLQTDKPFNLWTTDPTGPPTTATVTASLGNLTASAMTIDANWVVHDYDGRVVVNDSTHLTVQAQKTHTFPIKISLADRGFYVVDVTASQGTVTQFWRTTIASLPQHDFGGLDPGYFGLSNEFLADVGPITLSTPPTDDDYIALLERLGVTRLRGHSLDPAAAEQAGVQENVHASLAYGADRDDASALRTWIDERLDICQTVGAAHLEYMNEWNAVGHVGSAESAKDYATYYLPALADAIEDRGQSIKIMNGGMAGMDEAWLSAVHDNDGYAILDEIALHPGRGNFTADYAPAPDTWAHGSHGSFWNYLGAVKYCQEIIRQYGIKPLELTETYACTFPNRWWYDTYRHAAENTLLQLALGMAEGVSTVYFYQLNNGFHSNPRGVSGSNEYNYGLLNYDLGPKPSLLAYATAAEHLNRATFVGWADLPGNSQGLVFDTPKGTMSILWDRTEGYLLNTDSRDGAFFPAPELWVDPWTTQVEVEVKVKGCKATRVDLLGREHDVTKHAGRAHITLSGEPQIYYGLLIPLSS